MTCLQCLIGLGGVVEEKCIFSSVCRSAGAMGNKAGVEYYSHGIQGRRDAMEDAELCLPTFGKTDALFGIFDGHFGANCSKFVCSALPKNILKESNYSSAPKDALVQAFMKTDKEWLKMAKDKKMQDGSTGCVVLIKDNKIYCANTGDSRAVMSVGGKTVALSEDHKPETPAEQKRIEKAGGVILMGRVQGRLAVARSFGDIEMKNADTGEPKFLTPEPDVREFDLTEDTDFIIVACDGLWDKFSNEDAVKYVHDAIAEGKNVKQITQDIVMEAFKKGSQDNISATIVMLKTLPKSNSKPKLK